MADQSPCYPLTLFDNHSRFCREYNFERPHDALNDQFPNQVFVPPTKPFPNRLPNVESPDDFLLRSVRTEGTIRWKGGLIYLSKPQVIELTNLSPPRQHAAESDQIGEDLNFTDEFKTLDINVVKID